MTSVTHSPKIWGRLLQHASPRVSRKCHHSWVTATINFIWNLLTLNLTKGQPDELGLGGDLTVWSTEPWITLFESLITSYTHADLGATLCHLSLGKALWERTNKKKSKFHNRIIDEGSNVITRLMEGVTHGQVRPVSLQGLWVLPVSLGAALTKSKGWAIFGV